MAQTNGNNVNPITALINGVMRDATTEGNRQASLVVALFDSEATFGKASILNVMRKTGTDKTEAIDKMLSPLSDEYAQALQHLEESKEARKEAKGSEKQRLTFSIESITRKVRAARIMLERALISVYGLRERKATKCVTINIGTGALKVTMPDQDGDPEAHKLSCNEVYRSGKQLMDSALGKSAKARNPKANARNGIADASKSLAATLGTLNKDGKLPAVSDFSDETEKNVESAFELMFRMHFADDKGEIDRKAVNEWIAEHFPTEDKKAA